MCCLQTIQCTVAGCSCECFAPGKAKLRMCDTCEHGWVVHGKPNKLDFNAEKNIYINSFKQLVRRYFPSVSRDTFRKLRLK